MMRRAPSLRRTAAVAAALRLRRLGIDTCQEAIAYIRSDSPVCKAEGFEARSRLELWCGGRRIVAPLKVVHFPLIGRAPGGGCPQPGHGAARAAARSLYAALTQPLFTLHAGSPGELAYALAYAQAQDNFVTIGEAG